LLFYYHLPYSHRPFFFSYLNCLSSIPDTTDLLAHPTILASLYNTLHTASTATSTTKTFIPILGFSPSASCTPALPKPFYETLENRLGPRVVYASPADALGHTAHGGPGAGGGGGGVAEKIRVPLEFLGECQTGYARRVRKLNGRYLAVVLDAVGLGRLGVGVGVGVGRMRGLESFRLDEGLKAWFEGGSSRGVGEEGGRDQAIVEERNGNVSCWEGLEKVFAGRVWGFEEMRGVVVRAVGRVFETGRGRVRVLRAEDVLEAVRVLEREVGGNVGEDAVDADKVEVVQDSAVKVEVLEEDGSEEVEKILPARFKEKENVEEESSETVTKNLKKRLLKEGHKLNSYEKKLLSTVVSPGKYLSFNFISWIFFNSLFYNFSAH
jgi:hypothetical protein